jgi:hypothetical protein
MGYTVYVKNQLAHHPMKRWQMFVEAVKHVASEINIPLADWDGTGKPQFNNKEVAFNGVGDEDSCETFRIDRVYEYRHWDDQTKPIFNFCKTGGYRPYDAMVKATLLLYWHFFPQCEISCDGGMEEFALARHHVAEITGLTIFPELKETIADIDLIK